METLIKYWYIWGALLLIGGFAIGKNWNKISGNTRFVPNADVTRRGACGEGIACTVNGKWGCCYS